MIETIKVSDLDWCRNKVVTAPVRGNRMLASYVVNKNETYSVMYGKPKQRCAWPTSILNSDSRYISRKVQSQVR